MTVAYVIIQVLIFLMQGITVPHVRISLKEGKSIAYLQAVSDSVQAALIDAIQIKATDRFQIIEQLPTTQFIVSNPLVGVAHGENVISLYITLKAGRTLAAKKHLYQQLAANLAANPGIPQEDVLIMLVETPAENWSFGSGLATLID